jgi:PPP family 3-phenylpropionic acid transporter
MDARAFSLRFKAFNALLFIGSGIQLPFMPLWLHAKGLAPAQIALIMALMMGVRSIATPIGAYIADRTGKRRQVIVTAAFAAFAAFAVLALMNGFWPILMVAVTAAAFFSPVSTLGEVMAIEGCVAHGLDFGRIRLWASISFLLGNVLSGALLDVVAVSWVIYFIIAAQGMGALITLVLPEDPIRRSFSGAPVTVTRVLRHALTGPFFIFLAAVTIGQASHGMFYAIGSVHWDHQGLSKFLIGELWAIGVLAEVLFFQMSRSVVAKFRPEVMIVAGISGGLLRWLIFAINPSVVLLHFGSMLHAMSFALTHLGTMHFIQQRSPGVIRNSVQGVYSSLYGALLSATMWASGPLYTGFGGMAYLAMAGLSAVALGLAVLLARLTPTEPA